MEVKIINEYQIVENKVFTGSFDIDLEAELKDRYIEDCCDLENEIREIVFWKDKTCINPYNKEDLNKISEENDDSYEIENIEELIDYFKHLIPKKSCCDEALYGSNFCPTCGKPIQ